MYKRQEGSTQGLDLALVLAGFLFLSQFQSGPGAAAVIARLVAVSACSLLNCKTRVRRLYTAHFTHYFHIAQITAIQPPLFRVGRESGGREGVGQKALLPRTKACQSKRCVSAAPLECGVMGKLFTGTAVGLR